MAAGIRHEQITNNQPTTTNQPNKMSDTNNNDEPTFRLIAAATSDCIKRELLDEINSLEEAIQFHNWQISRTEDHATENGGNHDDDVQILEEEVSDLQAELDATINRLLVLRDRGFKELLLSEFNRSEQVA